MAPVIVYAAGEQLVTLPGGARMDKDARILKEFPAIPDLDLLMAAPVPARDRGALQRHLRTDLCMETFRIGV